MKNLILIAILCLGLVGCNQPTTERDTLPIPSTEQGKKSYDTGYSLAIGALNMLAWISPNKADWDAKIKEVWLSVQEPLTFYKHGTVTAKAALEMIKANVPVKAHWFDFVDSLWDIWQAYGEAGFLGASDGIGAYLEALEKKK